KSTLLALVARFFDPDAGAVLIDGHDLRQVTVRSVRDQTAIALQEHVLFAATVRDNLLYGRAGASDAEVRASAAVACVDEFVATLPEGYDTMLGERGTKLSTGQRQRIGIARAVLKDAPIVLLDEPTASLDAATERRVLDNLQAWSAGRCVFLVTHRLSAARPNAALSASGCARRAGGSRRAGRRISWSGTAAGIGRSSRRSAPSWLTRATVHRRMGAGCDPVSPPARGERDRPAARRLPHRRARGALDASLRAPLRAEGEPRPHLDRHPARAADSRQDPH